MIGKTVLVTGAAKRVGRSIAREVHAADERHAFGFVFVDYERRALA